MLDPRSSTYSAATSCTSKYTCSTSRGFAPHYEKNASLPTACTCIIPRNDGQCSATYTQGSEGAARVRDAGQAPKARAQAMTPHEDDETEDALDDAVPCAECPTCGAFVPVSDSCETCADELGGEA